MRKKILHIIMILLFSGLFLALEANDKTGALNSDSAFFEVQTDVLIYPNPLVGNTFKVKGTNIQSVEVINVIGQVIVKKDFENSSTEQIDIRLDNCDKGMYLVKVNFTNKKSVIKKLLLK